MTSRDFCYWLQGFFEIQKAQGNSKYQNALCATQVDLIERHLGLVFQHEIDPSLDKGDPVKQTLYQHIHDGTVKPVMRC